MIIRYGYQGIWKANGQSNQKAIEMDFFDTLFMNKANDHIQGLVELIYQYFL